MRLVLTCAVAWSLAATAASAGEAPAPEGPMKSLRVRLEWGHGLKEKRRYAVQVKPYATIPPADVGTSFDPRTKATGCVEGLILLPTQVTEVEGVELEKGESKTSAAGGAEAWSTEAGAGDVDGVTFTIRYPDVPAVAGAFNINTPVGRQAQDKFMYGQVNQARVTVLLNAEGTLGFSLAVHQLLAEKTCYLPDLGVYISAGEPFVPFAEHQAALTKAGGRRVLDRVRAAPETGYQEIGRQFGIRNRFLANFLSWEGAPAKFAIPYFGWDISAQYGIYASAPLVIYNLPVKEGTRGDIRQSLEEAVLVLHTAAKLKDGGVEVEFTQFAYPLEGETFTGKETVVLFSRLHLSNPAKEARTVSFGMELLPESSVGNPELKDPAAGGGAECVSGDGGGKIAWNCQAEGTKLACEPVKAWDKDPRRKCVPCKASVTLAPGASASVTVKYPRPAVPPDKAELFRKLDFDAALTKTRAYWQKRVAQTTAVYEVPEPPVSRLLKLLVSHELVASNVDPKTGIRESPIGVQADSWWQWGFGEYRSMRLLDSFGLHDVAGDYAMNMIRKWAAMTDAEDAKHSGWPGYALMAVGEHYLLSDDKGWLDKAVGPATQVGRRLVSRLQTSRASTGMGRGLAGRDHSETYAHIASALMSQLDFKGLQGFSRALRTAGIPDETFAAESELLRRDILSEFKRATTRSPAVKLKDGTWIPYVPFGVLSQPGYNSFKTHAYSQVYSQCSLVTPGLFGAGDPHTAWMLNDFADNLSLSPERLLAQGQYAPEGYAYLEADEIKAFLNLFYTYQALVISEVSGCSQEFTWNTQCTGAALQSSGAEWFMLFREMLVRESGEKSLFLCQATPRDWLADGKAIRVENAPTLFGPVNVAVRSEAAKGRILATVAPPRRTPVEKLTLRLRHPQEKPMKAVTVNGKPWKGFDPARETIVLPAEEGKIEVEATY